MADARPSVDRVITLPDSWWESRRRRPLHYFIPEHDDMVDPRYDFSTDTHSYTEDPWLNNVYSHQLYPSPNYDGILVSYAAVTQPELKWERLQALGVHRYLRVPDCFPVMGDCGAFDYIDKAVPPYTTTQVIDYYTKLGFDYGTSVDHLIVSSTLHQYEQRRSTSGWGTTTSQLAGSSVGRGMRSSPSSGRSRLSCPRTSACTSLASAG
jgi:hypothetical protein